MAIERKDPIPVGRYWVDLADNKVQNFHNWAAAFPEYVRVQTTEKSAGRTFLIFRIENGPVPRWPAGWGLGFPTTAPPNVNSLQDVVQKPSVPQTSLGDFFANLGTAGVVGLAVVAFFLMKRK